jgi:hypothetical protein
MATNRSLKAVGPAAAADVAPPGEQDFFGPPQLIEGEDPVAYQAFLSHVTAAVQPKNAIEGFLLRDVVDLTWEAVRLRRLKASRLRTLARETVNEMFEPSLGYAAAIELSQRWARREPSALKKVTRYLAGSGLTVDSVMAQTLASNLDDFERFDRLLASAEARRNSALHEIDRHRTEFGAALRAAADRIEDAEFTDVEPLDSVKLSAA